MDRYDAVVVGSGPNGLSAAVTLAQAGRSVMVIEGAATIGGGCRTMELTLPGFRHDHCSAVHPFAASSPYLRTLPLDRHGLTWVQPDLPVAHPVTPDRVGVLPRDLDEAAEVLGSKYADTMRWIVGHWPEIEQHIFGPLARLPAHPLAMARFGLNAALPAEMAIRRIPTEEGKALFAGCAAHAFLPLDHPFTASFAWFMMAGAHLYGWPMAAGGSQAITDALASYLRSLGGEICTGWPVTTMAELPPSKLVLMDVSPEGFARIARDRLPAGYLERVGRYRRGPAAFKVDYALDGPVPWAHPDLARAGTIHVGGTAAEVTAAEADAVSGRVNRRPLVLVAQPAPFDPSRAPVGKGTLWAYAHVPHASRVDYTEAVDAQIERFAPGFSRRVIAKSVRTPADLEHDNPNLVGGEIAGGAHTLRQLVFRPFPQTNPYATPLAGVYLCSSSTPPGAGTHGMCGHHAARAALAGK